ncbi:MaoC family dehydratase N-terminal domain-containing protein [Rhizobiaceae sp. 2RAB30]
MSGIDVEKLRTWIGRTETAEDTITPRLVREFRATLGSNALERTDIAPPAIHWCLAPTALPPEKLGRDGHPEKGGFLPPVPLPRRMWAGGRIAFHRPLVESDAVTRTSRITDIAAKSGRSGDLVFVTVEHEFATERGLAVREEQDIVYREDRAAGSAPAPVAEAAGAHHVKVEATTTLLFRYSALTFNGHRIHYDVDYARDVESYAGLVVHGPLQATLMLHLAAKLNGGDCPARFSYRGMSPLFAGAPFSVIADGTGLSFWTASGSGHVTMRASCDR